jgi:hypothetical protein
MTWALFCSQMVFVNNWIGLLKIYGGVSPRIKLVTFHSNLGIPYVCQKSRVALDSDSWKMWTYLWYQNWNGNCYPVTTAYGFLFFSKSTSDMVTSYPLLSHLAPRFGMTSRQLSLSYLLEFVLFFIITQAFIYGPHRGFLMPHPLHQYLDCLKSPPTTPWPFLI